MLVMHHRVLRRLSRRLGHYHTGFHSAKIRSGVGRFSAGTNVLAMKVRVLLDPGVPDDCVRSVVWERVGHQRVVDTATAAEELAATLPGGHLAMMTVQYRKARKFAPAVLAAFEFRASTESRSLLAAIEVLKGLYATRARKLPEGAPVEFVPDRWAKHVWDDDGRLDRHGWEMCVLSELRNALRGANVWIDDGRCYQDRPSTSSVIWSGPGYDPTTQRDRNQPGSRDRH